MLLLSIFLQLLSPPAFADLRPTGIHWGVLPVANYTSDQGANLGVVAQRFDYGAFGTSPFDTLLTLQATIAERGPKTLYLAYELTRAWDRPLRLRNEIFYSENPFQNYFGLGNETLRVPSLERASFYRYSLRQISLESSVRVPVASITGLSLQSGLGLQLIEQRPLSFTSRYAQDFGNSVQNFNAPRVFLRGILERRNSEFIPSSGDFALVSLQFSPRWNRGDAEYRKYFPLLQDRFLWLATQAKWVGTSSHAPLSERARLGSRGTLRGLALNRYLAAQAFSLRAELRSVNVRWTLFGMPLKFGQGLFFDIGRVGDSMIQILTAKTHFAWGFSLFGSYFTDDFLGGLDVGFSEGSYSYYFNLGFAF